MHRNGWRLIVIALFMIVLAGFPPLLRGRATRNREAVHPTPAYTIRSIALTSSGFGNSAPAINNAGKVVHFYPLGGCTRAFVTSGDVVAEITGRDPCAYATAINDAGDVVVNRGGTGGYSGVLYKRPAPVVAISPLPPDYRVAIGYGINDKAIVVGEAVITPPATKTEAFLFEAIPFAGRITRLGTLGGERASALDINNSGIVVGWSQTRTVPAPTDPRANDWYVRPGHAFAYTTRDGMKDLNNVLPAKSEWELRKANAISDQGHIVGFGYNATARTIRAFLMIHNSVTDLGTFRPLGGMSYALAVNNRGEAVGAAYLDASGEGNFRACIFRKGEALNLNSMIDSPDWLLNEATGINDKGQIVGWGAYRGEYRVFLLTPR